VPVHDWQFWVVTTGAVIAAVFIVRAAIPEKYRPGRRRRGKAANLTIGGRSVPRKK